MNFSLDKYPEIKRYFGEKWLKTSRNKNHPIFRIIDENEYLNNLNRYLEHIELKKATVTNLQASTMFFDVYYELEIAHFLRESGFKPELNEKISGHETDIFLREQGLVIEITHLHIPAKIESAAARFKPKSKIQDIPRAINVTHLMEKHMLNYFGRRIFQNMFPNIVCFCPDIKGSCDDLGNVVTEKCIPIEVNALALWRFKKILCLYEIPSRARILWKSNKLREFFCQK